MSDDGSSKLKEKSYSINSHWNDEKGTRHVVPVKTGLTMEEALAEKEKIIQGHLDEALKNLRQQYDEMYKIQ